MTLLYCKDSETRPKTQQDILDFFFLEKSTNYTNNSFITRIVSSIKPKLHDKLSNTLFLSFIYQQ